jgi:hypothetical protein
VPDPDTSQVVAAAQQFRAVVIQAGSGKEVRMAGVAPDGRAEPSLCSAAPELFAPSLIMSYSRCCIDFITNTGSPTVKELCGLTATAAESRHDWQMCPPEVQTAI